MPSPFDGILIDREAIWVALQQRLADSLGNKVHTLGRQHVRPPALSPEQQPACFVVEVRENRNPRPSGVGGKITLNGFLILYFQCPQFEDAGAESQLGATVLNGLLLAIDQALLPDSLSQGTLTLGGLVQHCWIDGDVDYDPGIMSQQGAAILPIRILVP